MSSKEKRAHVISLMQANAINNPDNYLMYIIACMVSWFFKDSPGGLSTVEQVNVFNHVHRYISLLDNMFDTAELSAAHGVMHELQEELIEKLKEKGMISADDYGFTDEDELLSKHATDFSAWAEELSPSKEEE